MSSAKKPTYEKEPDKFPWEAPAPTGPFWSDITEKISAQCLTIFGAEGLAQLPLDASLPKDQKIRLLRTLLEEKLAASESATDPKSMSEEEFKRNRTIRYAIASTYAEAKDWKSAHDVCKDMSTVYEARNEGRPDVGAMNMQAWTAEKIGEYSLADAYCIASLPHLAANEQLGPDSPQVLGTMRLRMLVLGKVGRVMEAKALNARGYEVIENMRAGRFAKYADEEVDAMDEIRGKLEEAEREKGMIPEAWEPLQSA